MRQIVAYEGREIIPGQLLELGSCEWLDDKEVPIYMALENRKKLGFAKDFQNESDGSITADIHWYDSYRVDFGTTIRLVHVDYSVDANGFVVVHCGVIESLFLDNVVAWAATGKLPVSA